MNYKQNNRYSQATSIIYMRIQSMDLLTRLLGRDLDLDLDF